MIIFSPDDGQFGSHDCNRVITSASASEIRLILANPIVMSRMACPGDAFSNQDDAFARLNEGSGELQFDPFSKTLALTRYSIRLTLTPKLANEN